jgi:type II secretory pathway predicted ATPase ExeA
MVMVRCSASPTDESSSGMAVNPGHQRRRNGEAPKGSAVPEFIEAAAAAPAVHERKKMIEVRGPQEQKDVLEDHFGFRERPFGVTPNPRFFYSNPAYQEGLAALVSGIQSKKGLLLLTGEVGTGKTILLRRLMLQLEASVKFIFVSTSHLSSFGLIQLMVQSLMLNSEDRSILEMMHDLNRYLITQVKEGQTVALLIDEAQKLSDETLEALGDLSNLETDQEKLLQIVLVGQPELVTKLNKPALRRIKQRIALHYRLRPLQTIADLEHYIRHRLQLASYDGSHLFSRDAIEAIWYYSAGTPRLINIICGNALTMACEAAKRHVTYQMVVKVADTLLLDRGGDAPRNGFPENGAPKAVVLSVSTHPKTAETNGTHVRAVDRAEKPVAPLLLANPKPTSSNVPKKRPVTQELFERMTRAAAEAMGPMAHVVVLDQISALAETPDAFPESKLQKLIGLVSREILNETMKARFESTMFRELAALKDL